MTWGTGTVQLSVTSQEPPRMAPTQLPSVCQAEKPTA